MRKIIILVLAVLLVSVNAYALEITTLAPWQNHVSNDDNLGRDHIDIVCRYFIDDAVNGGVCSDANHQDWLVGQVASEGAVVIWATNDNAIMGLDVTMTWVTDSTMVAGVVSESGGIASGSYGRVRIYGYFDDVILADATDNVTEAGLVGTAGGFTGVEATIHLLGNAGASAGSGASRIGVALDSGAAGDGDLDQVMINVVN